MNTGEPIDRAQVKDVKFNEMAVFYVLKKNYGDLKAGMIVPNSYIEEARNAGVVEPQLLAFGLQAGAGGKSIYFPVSNVALSQIMDSSPKDRPTIEALQKALEDKRKSLATGTNLTDETKPKEKPKTVKSDTGTSKSVVDANKGSSSYHQGSGGAAIVKKKKSAEEQAEDIKKSGL